MFTEILEAENMRRLILVGQGALGDLPPACGEEVLAQEDFFNPGFFLPVLIFASWEAAHAHKEAAIHMEVISDDDAFYSYRLSSVKVDDMDGFLSLFGGVVHHTMINRAGNFQSLETDFRTWLEANFHAEGDA